jgi:hypothetical protein
MDYKIYHEREDTPHYLLAICSTQESAERWINNFNPRIWDNKTLRKENLVIRKEK